MSHKPQADAIVDGTIVDADVAAANKDGTSGTASMRTLGTGATQACAGNDSRVTGAEQTANKNAASGYAGLSAGTLLALAQMGTGTPTGSNFLRGDGTWAAPTASYSTTTQTKATNYTTLTTDDYLLVDSSGATRTITLHAASTATKPVHIKKTQAANTVVIDPNASETIDGTATRTLTQQYEAVTCVSDGSNWFIF